MNDLRPIGTEFEITYPPDPYTVPCVFTTWRYRVVRYAGVCEVIEPIADAVRIPAWPVFNVDGTV